MTWIRIAAITFFLILRAFAACDAGINLDVQRPFNSEADPTVVHAVATSGCGITAMSVYVDYKLIYQQRGPDPINARLVMKAGQHRVVVLAENAANNHVSDVRYITTTADPVEPPAGCELPEANGVFYSGDEIPFTVKGPTRIGMIARSSARISSIRMYIDGSDRAQVWGTTGYCLPVAFLNLKPGYHFINLQAWDANGRILLTGSIVQVVP